MTTTQGPAGRPITGRTTVREAVARYPGIEAVFEKHGIAGCGGPGGPIEPIDFFARVHQVDPDALIEELNRFALTRRRRRPAAELPGELGRSPDFYFIPISAGVLLALLAGFPLGALAAFAAVHDVGIGPRWTPLVQAHGHLQIMGWVGLFIMGVAYHVLPRFKAVALRPSGLVWPSFLLLLGGIALRTGSQPWGEVSWVSGLLVSSAALELAGVAAFAVVVAGTVSAGRRETYDAFLLAAVIWLVAASVANLVVLVDTVSAGAAVIAQAKDTPLLAMYLYGFIALFIFGISLRVLPAFLDLRPPRGAALVPAFLLFNAGVALLAVTGWVQAYGGWEPPIAVESTAAYLLAGGIGVFARALNVYLPSVRSEGADPERGFERLIRAAYVWLAVAAGLEVWLATRALTGGDALNFLEAGAARHALAVGFITQIMFGVAFRALPVFAGKTLHSQRLVDVTFVLINAAAAARVVPAIAETGSVTSRFDLIGVSGALGLLAVGVFAYNIVRTVLGPTVIVAPSREEESEMPERERAKEAFVATKDSIVADVLARVPGSLELLISYGLTPLQDPALRATVTRHVTLQTASQVHTFDVEAVVRKLNQMAEAATDEAGAGEPTEATAPPPLPTQEAPPAELNAARLLMALRDCYDPEMPANIVDLGLVYDFKIDGDRVSIKMTLTSPDCPAANQVVSDVTEAVRRLGAQEVEVELVREPQWTPSRMTPAARAALGLERE